GGNASRRKSLHSEPSPVPRFVAGPVLVLPAGSRQLLEPKGNRAVPVGRSPIASLTPHRYHAALLLCDQGRRPFPPNHSAKIRRTRVVDAPAIVFPVPA